MNYKEFGRHLLETGDLDPLYIILNNTEWGSDTLYRFLLGYWIFYAAGPSCILAEAHSDDFYDIVRRGDALRWPRGHERRHMRGKLFNATVDGLEAFGPPEAVVNYVLMGDRDNYDYNQSFEAISSRAQTFRGFGPWIAWKIADMAERVVGMTVDFSNTSLWVYRDPVKGAALIEYGQQDWPITKEQLAITYQRMEYEFREFLAPPYYDRPVNIQEMETIACKWKSHTNGHYPLGNDTVDIYKGLDGWGELAYELRAHLRPYYEQYHKE